jgi:hypothetical protein
MIKKIFFALVLIISSGVSQAQAWNDSSKWAFGILSGFGLGVTSCENSCGGSDWDVFQNVPVLLSTTYQSEALSGNSYTGLFRFDAGANFFPGTRRAEFGSWTNYLALDAYLQVAFKPEWKVQPYFLGGLTFPFGLSLGAGASYNVLEHLSVVAEVVGSSMIIPIHAVQFRTGVMYHF